MTNSIKLREFQLASVRAVCDGLAKRRIYALADEVGLGKTLVCAEVVNQIVSGKSKNPYHIIYYVAPSIELLHQNLRSIGQYLKARCGDKFHVLTSISRLAQVPRDLAEQKQRLGKEFSEKRVVHIVGLSPATSFGLRGAGQLAERIYLAALFGFWKSEETKHLVARAFWCLQGPFSGERKRSYLERIGGYESKEFLGQLEPFRDTGEFERLLNEVRSMQGAALKHARSKVAEVRRGVVEFLIEKVSPTFVILDEWHKYKDVCFKNPLLGRFLEQSRKSAETKVLLVSATPFSVEFKETGQGDAQLEDAEDLEGLLQMVWGKANYEDHYKRLLDDQVAYMDSLAAYLAGSAQDDGNLLSCRSRYEEHLREYCTRTERPRVEMGADSFGEGSREGSWKEVTKSRALSGLLKRFNKGERVRSPVLAMWSDGDTFPSYGYPGLNGHNETSIPGVQWKLERLKEKLAKDFGFSDGFHSFRYPPLWLRPEKHLQNRKHLVFSEFLFVPDEICTDLDAGRGKFGSVAKKKWTGSVIGYFPLKGKRKGGTAESAAEAIHFVLFYPFLFFERDPNDRAVQIQKHNAEIKDIISRGDWAISVVRDLEVLLAGGSTSSARMNLRWATMEEHADIPASARFKAYLRFLLFSKEADWAPGFAVARILGRIWREGGITLEAKGSQALIREFERASMALSSAVLRMFSSPEARTLKARARVAMPRRVGRGWNSHVKFAMWYSKKFGLRETLSDFVTLLSAAGSPPAVLIEEVSAAISLRKGAVGNRFVRSFHDRKISDSEEDAGTHEAISVKSLRAAFNSPFPPYVLVSTSVGQEGLDFHRYCASVIHWSPPSSPSILRQREGRVDRFQSLQIRRALDEYEKSDDEKGDGMCPDFVVMKEGKRINRVEREVWYLPFTVQEAAWKMCLQRMYYNDVLIGAPDPLSDERLLLSAVGAMDFTKRSERFEKIRKYAISLSPSSNAFARIQKGDMSL